ncbi:potassium transporter TrkG [Cyanobium sp. NIES-981]|uniref:potassium transporter TrkG n=1 Tax=Cyanobium sp. NIES-981 TaxID=1851505 RepID=UPI0007DDBB02|nr:potassium transporter TrkG [Cyanobium sp. NIES-981]SBO41865.1 Potassium uptake protein KtrB [Cyanobium sp. NIES-981]
MQPPDIHRSNLPSAGGRGHRAAPSRAWEALQRWRHRLTVPQFTVITGALVIAAGTVVLASPLCSTDSVGLWEALFTVTSAITVTGLSVIDIGTELTPFGQVALAGLIITGGLGLMAITTFLQGFVQGHSGLRARLDKGRALDDFGVGGIGPTFNSILVAGSWMMGLGTAVLYFFGFTDISDPLERLWASLFHAISAYNNAGFGLWSDSLVRYRDNAVVNTVIATMIVVGGIGWRVINDLWANRARRRPFRMLSLHSRLVIRSTLLLILFGCLGLLFTEHFATGGVIEPLTGTQKLQVTLFQSITTRTAGFNTVPLSAATFSDAGLLLVIVLMFIGASPGGTGGGIKTTTFATLMAATRSTLKGREDVVIHSRQIPDRVVLRAIGVTIASLIFVLLMALLLGLGPTASGEPNQIKFSFLEKLFTCMSAFATVGLDLGVTDKLNRWGQLVLMVGMFVGRLGILLLLSALYGNRPQTRVGYPREELYI